MRAQELEVKSQNYWLMVAELRKAHQWRVTELQLFNRDGVAYGVGECKVY